MFFLALIACDPDIKESEPIVEDIPKDCEAVVGNICTWAGTPGVAAFDGGGNHRLSSYFYWPMDIEFSPYGKPVIADWNNHQVRMVEEDNSLKTVIGTKFVGDGDPVQGDLVAPGVPGTTINLNHPTQAIYYPDGTLLSSSWHTFKFRTWDPATGLTYVLWGAGPGFTGENGEDATGKLNSFLTSVVMDSNENLYFIDQRNLRVRELTADYKLWTIAGTGTAGYTGDGGPANAATLSFPVGNQPEPGGSLAMSADEKTLFVADTMNSVIRAINLDDGSIRTVAGTGIAGYSGDGGPATAAQLNQPRDLEVDADGNIYIADTDNHTIRMVATDGTISTLAGTGTSGATGDEGPAVDATLYRPFGVALGTDGNLYVADTYNHAIRVIFR